VTHEQQELVERLHALYRQHGTNYVQQAPATIGQLAERCGRLEAALRRIYFLDHNEREWESVDEIKQFARRTLEHWSEKAALIRSSSSDATEQPKRS
jgi:tRNA C32,U32 (ribose-2'-O)-methylase TrmJ